MKKLAFALTMLCSFALQADTIITVPIDSRPISVQYLENLVNLGGDDFLSVGGLDTHNSFLDPPYSSGNSIQVRQELKNLASEYNTEDTTIIINSASAIYGGLIDSRQVKVQATIDEAMAELMQIMTQYENPTYYVHINMPRTLPEPTAGAIWPNDDKMNGLGYYFAKYNPSYAGQVNQTVSADELLLEWGYVENKSLELGYNSLYEWEKDFINDFHNLYYHNSEYTQFIENYKYLYVQASNIVKEMMSNLDIIDELVISVDDYQLPRSIQIISKFVDVPAENNNPIKFSWSRKYLETDTDSVYNYQKLMFGEDSLQNSLAGMGHNINYIYGTDEIPQMIYARDLAKRESMTTTFLPLNANFIDGALLYDTGTYDVVTTKDLYDQRLNYVTCANPYGDYYYGVLENPNSKSFEMYLNKYSSSQTDTNISGTRNMAQNIFMSYESGNNVGVIELYNSNLELRSQQFLLNELLNYDVSNLATYSSWNTEGNAIGLGLAHAQVFGIVDMSPLTFDEATERGIYQYEILLQHLIEDNLFTAGIKSAIAIEDYASSWLLTGSQIYKSIDDEQQVTYEYIQDDELVVVSIKQDNADNVINMTLLTQMPIVNLIDKFKESVISVAGHSVQYDEINLSTLTFPWTRTYDLYVDLDIK
ncbi:MAG: hypothetical protein ATN35_01390 [Epulopiscium sp. Nele67-Bin004]|nr:MAG: hypothetical protein ATN35_01390 [Epulopiscium sp. Nele67-Bin004]